MASLSSSTPAIRGYQVDSGGSGNASESVNLFTGDINYSLPLVHLPGPAGLDVSLAAMYSSEVVLQPITWNLDAPTGVLGLGWSLSFDQIQFVTSETASYLEGQYAAQIGGRSVQLTLIEWNQTGDPETLLFAAADDYQLWTFTYYPATETWIVLRDDGVTATFGAPDITNSYAVQWGVRWGNWAGNSAAPGEGEAVAQQFATAWNLTQVQDQWGNTITHFYIAEEQPIAGSLNITRASYVSEIVDAYGRTVSLTYGSKQQFEYQPPHTSGGSYPYDQPAGAWQDNYPTYYLQQIDVLAPGGDLLHTVVLTYQVMSLGPTSAGVSNPQDPCMKRYLTGVAQQRFGRQICPSLTFAYDLCETSPSCGRMTQVTYPTGGTATWGYTQLTLGDSATFDMNCVIAAPSGFTFAGIWFGGDYVVIAWYNRPSEQLVIHIMQYGGRWAAATPYSSTIYGVNPALVNGVPLLQLAFGPDFFALYWHNQSNQVDNLFVFQQVPYQFGQWNRMIFSDLVSGDYDQSESALVAGDNFIALHPAGSLNLYTFTYDRRSLTWSPQPGSGSYEPIHGAYSEATMALAADGNLLAVGFFEATGSSDVYARYQVYWLNTGSSGPPIFEAGFENYDSYGPFAWDSAYIAQFLALGCGCAVATYAQSSTAQIVVLSWDWNYSSFSVQTLAGDVLTQDPTSGTVIPQATVVAGSTLANGSQLYRFNGIEWVSGQFNFTNLMLTGSDDCVVAANTADNGAPVPVAQFDPLASGDASGAWSSGMIYPEGEAEPAQLGGSFLTYGANLYYANTNFPTITQSGSNPWQSVSGVFAGNYDAGSVVCQGPNYVAYQFTDENGLTSTDVVQLLNGAAYTPAGGNAITTLSGESMVNPITGIPMCSATAFATYDSGDNPSSIAQINLYRILNLVMQGFVTDVAVTQVVIDTGTQLLTTNYEYNTATAVFDPTGTVAQYPNVTAEQVDPDNNSLGSTVYSYYNGLPPTGDGDPLASCYSLAGGYVASQVEYDDSGNEVSTSLNTWQGVTLLTQAQGGFTPLTNVTVVCLQSNVSTLTNLQIVDFANNSSIASNGQRSLTTTLTYVEATGHPRSKTMVLYAANGQQQTRTVTRTYAWEVYSGMQSPGNSLAPMLTSEAMTCSQIGGNPINAKVRTFAEYPTAMQGSAWAESSAWQWTGGGTIESGLPVFDYDNPAGNTANWTCGVTINQRTMAGGRPQIVSNALGVPASMFYDVSGLWPTAAFANSDGTDCAFTGFESYENPNPWTGGALITEDAHTGESCVSLSLGETLTCSSLQSAGTQSQYILSCFVKSDSGTTGNLSLQVGDASPAELTFAADSNWQYVFVYADCIAAEQVIACAIGNTGSGALLVDDVCIMPVVGTFSAPVYNELMLPVAEIRQNGATKRMFYDIMLNPFATSEPDDQLTGLHGTGYAPGGFDAAAGNFNVGLSIGSCDGGPFEDFSDTNWQQRWLASDPDNWSLANGTLTYNGSTVSSITMESSSGYSGYAVHVQVNQGQGATPASGSFGISIGNLLTAQWNAATGNWELLDDDGSVLAAAPSVDGDAPILPSDIVLVAYGQAAVLFVNQQLTLSFAFPSTYPALGGALTLFTDTDGLGFAQVLVFLTPVSHLVFLDGKKRTVQSQQLCDNFIVVAQQFYDGRGRPAITTKPAIYGPDAPNDAPTVFGYQSSFATAPDTSSDTPTISGYVSDYYDGSNGLSNDGGYPYWRTNYENSGRERPLATGCPGAALAIAAGNSHTTTIAYGTNTANPFFCPTSVPAGEYDVVMVTDPDGLISTRIRDQLGNFAAAVTSGPNGVQPCYSSTAYNDRDDPASRMPPNGYAADSDPSPWQQLLTCDYFGHVTARTSNDSGTASGAYDNLGNLRFVLPANGAIGAPSNPCSGEVAILYTTYDALNRPIERGYAGQDSWDQATMESYANQSDWPTDGNWRFRYSYDGDGSTPYCHGRLTSVQTCQDDGTIVTEQFSYNLFGNLISRNTDVPDPMSGLWTGFSGEVTYEYDHCGRVTKASIPSLTGVADLVLLQSYDSRATLSSIAIQNPDGSTQPVAAYTWNAAGQPASETLGDGIVSRTLSYTSQGSISAITGSGNSEQLYYDESGSPGNPRYNGLLSGRVYQFGEGAPQTTWACSWDDHSRLIEVDVAGGAPFTYDYDGNGNIVSSNGAPFDFTAGTDQLAEDETGALTYDPSGELAENGDWSFAYDYTSDQVTEMTDGGSILTFAFGASPQRLVKAYTTNGTTEARSYLPGAGGRSVCETVQSSSGAPSEIQYIRSNMGMVAMQTIQDGEATLLYVVRDYLGSTRMVLDSSGAEVVSFDYQPFGLATPSDPGAASPYIYQFTGQEWDPETSFYNYRRRFYDPVSARFLSPDPAAQFFSPYLFNGGNPLQRTDPSGARSWQWGAAIGALEMTAGVALLIGATVAFGPAGTVAAGLLAGALIGGGVASESYSDTHKKNFHAKQFGDAEAGGAIGGAEVTAGVLLTVATDGAGYGLAGNTLMSMGFSGMSYSAEGGNQGAGSFWKGYGISQASGAAAGIVSGGIGMGGVALGESAGILGAAAENTESAAMITFRTTAASSVARTGWLVGVGVAEGSGGELVQNVTQMALQGRGNSIGNAMGKGSFWEQVGVAGALGGIGGGIEGYSDEPNLDWFRAQQDQELQHFSNTETYWNSDNWRLGPDSESRNTGWLQMQMTQRPPLFMVHLGYVMVNKAFDRFFVDRL